jgi:hypothetical protein
VLDETEYEFGRMEVGEVRTHAFTIRNEGEAPLLLRKGPTTCQCTLSELEAGELAAGQSAKITLQWKPTAQAEHFGKGADIRTNDPQQRTIHLRVLGMVAPRMVVYPEGTWPSPDLLEGETTTITGLIVSPVVEEFQVTALESATPLISAECLPIDPKQLESKHGLSGYRIRVSISPQIPIGAFSFPLKIKTDVPARSADGSLGGTTEMDVMVTGLRRGPIRIIGGAQWDENNMAVVMGAFDAKTGKKLSLPMFVRGPGAHDFQLIEPPQCQPEALRATVTRDEKSTADGKQSRFRLAVEYPAGSPKMSCRGDNPGKIRLRTNLAGAEEIELLVYFAAF